MGHILLVRHGQASFGSDDYDCLSALGVEQSRLLGAWLEGCGRKIDHVVVGGMKRHRQTADACLAAFNGGLEPLPPCTFAADIVTDAGFDEYDADEVVIRHRPEFADRAVVARYLAESGHPARAFQTVFSAAVDRWVAGENDGDYREPWSMFRTRCVAALQRITDATESSRTVIVFTSGGPITAICQHVLGVPDARIFSLNWSLVNAGVTALRYGPQRVSVNYLNNYAHLEQTKDARMITYR